MATNTTRLALRKPVDADDVDVDLDLSANWDKVDAGMGAIDCTSGARPSSPFNGMLARETDTGNIIRYNGTTWVVIVTADPVAATAGLRTLGTSATSACAGNDARLSDARTPTTHTHATTIATLTDGATVAVDASLGDYFRLSAGGDRTIGVPTNAVDGKQITIEILASSSARTISLTTGSSGAFIFGSDITALSQTASGKRDLIRAAYNSTLARWMVIGYVKGF